MDTRTKALVREALAERLAGLERRRGGVGSLAQQRSDIGVSDPEETLRTLMIRFWPRVRTGRALETDWIGFFSCLETLAEVARGDDLRFLDAFNNAFEALEVVDGWSRPEVNGFIVHYHEALELYLKQLTP